MVNPVKKHSKFDIIQLLANKSYFISTPIFAKMINLINKRLKFDIKQFDKSNF